MSGAFSRFGSLGRAIPRLRLGRLFNASGHAGPRRLMVLAFATAGVVGGVAVIAMTGKTPPPVSQDAHLPPVDPLPGGLHSTPEQDALALRANDAAAQAAFRKGVSFTPPMAPSQPVQPAPPAIDRSEPSSQVARRPDPPARRASAPRVPEPLQAAFPVPSPSLSAPAVVAPLPAPEMRASQVAATSTDPAADQAYPRQVEDLLSQWGARVPRTEMVLPPQSESGGEAVDEQLPPRHAPASGAQRAAPMATPVSTHSEEIGEILIPAGRGIYAHPILALSSDSSSPVVLQADSGPIAGDRMIGTFAKQEERLVIHVNTVIHNGENISCEGIVTAPDTMEAAVASNVDQHYLSRFLLPAAAAFVAGLGQAIAQTTNTNTVLSPFGGAAYATHLNIEQQLGVAAGTAAQQVGQTLSQSAPKGPTISLEANVAVGVMFLSNVTAHHHGR